MKFQAANQKQNDIWCVTPRSDEWIDILKQDIIEDSQTDK